MRFVVKIVFSLFIAFHENVFAEHISVIGTGYMGLVLSGVLADLGHHISCIDIDKNKINSLQSRHLPICEPGLEKLLFYSPSSCRITFSHDLKDIAGSSIIYICLGTPSNAEGRCDCSAIYSLLEDIFSLGPPHPSLFCVKSTVPPGTLRNVKAFISNLCEYQVDLVYNPEFMREGSALEDIMNKNPLVFGGESQDAIDRIEALYRPLTEKNLDLKILKTTFETAELIKYGWNSFSALRITYINELSRLCVNYTADIHALIEELSLSEQLSSNPCNNSRMRIWRILFAKRHARLFKNS